MTYACAFDFKDGDFHLATIDADSILEAEIRARKLAFKLFAKDIQLGQLISFSVYHPSYVERQIDSYSVN